MTDITRRNALAWFVPVVAVAVATPLAAASQPPTTDRIKFTNVTATVGKDPNKLYVNTKIQVIDGPASVEEVMLIVSISRDGVTQTRTWGAIGGWGSTEQVYLEFGDIPKGEPVTVTFTAQARGVTFIAQSVRVDTPGWWN